MKHLTKDQILAKMRETKRLTYAAGASAFTGMSTLCNYVLWKEEKWGQKKLTQYNAAVLEYDRKFYGGEITKETLSDRLWDKADFTIEYVPQTHDDARAKNKFMREMEKSIIDANNHINDVSQQYFLICFNVLMDMGYGNKRLNRVKDHINNWLKITSKDDGKKIMDLRRELIEGAGIYIEMPDLS